MPTNPTGTLWEHALPNLSLTHAWSSGVCDYFATTVLGVRMGFESATELQTVHVRPCAATLTWARGRVPHPLGDVTVAWERQGDRLQVEVDAPPGVRVEVAPGGPLAALACDTTIRRRPQFRTTDENATLHAPHTGNACPPERETCP